MIVRATVRKQFPMHQRDSKKNEHNGLSGHVLVWFGLFTLKNSSGDPFG